MAQMGILVDREDGSRFALNYNQQTTGNLFRSAKEPERLFRREEKLRMCFRSVYTDFYEREMDKTERSSGRQRGRFNYDFVVEEETGLIIVRLSSGFSTFKTVDALRECLSGVRDDQIWLLETGTPIPEEFQVINDRLAHVKILPSEHASVTVEKFQEMLCCLNWVKLSIEQEKRERKASKKSGRKC
ncbi:unnamed protein product [Pocillopora meandrina]|uniref:LAGLIDADG endonuclease n=1 Tax=Pocillopora meandrina TaxID=46732 RepID=A0AAU9WW73_9CNID|nr:unnamed protein product [Pocillopora meandrina]